MEAGRSVASTMGFTAGHMQIDCQHDAYEPGVDEPEIDGWVWP